MKSLFSLLLATTLLGTLPALARTDWATFVPPAYHPVFEASDKDQTYVQARSHDLYFWPFLDGQWLGVVTDPDGYFWFSFSTHSGSQHAQLFRYDPRLDRIDHIADLGQMVGEKLTGTAPQDKIHGAMFIHGDYLLAGTCDGGDGTNYEGGYWLVINRHTGVAERVSKSITGDGLLTVGHDPSSGMLYGHTNHHGKLTVFDPASGEESILGIPWQDVIDRWEADADPRKPKKIYPRGLTLMVGPDGKVYGGKPVGPAFWVYDPLTGKISDLEVSLPPLPEAVAAGEPKAVERWNKSGIHLAVWDEQDGCFYLIRSYDEMLCRFYPPTADTPARLETVQPMGLSQHRFNNRHPSCTLVLHNRTIYYTPYTGWGGITHLQSYQLDTGRFTDHGPIIVEDGRHVNECHAMDIGKDGKLYLAAFVFSKPDTPDPVTPWAMRDRYPFHSRLVIIDPGHDLKP